MTKNWINLLHHSNRQYNYKPNAVLGGKPLTSWCSAKTLLTVPPNVSDAKPNKICHPTLTINLQEHRRRRHLKTFWNRLVLWRNSRNNLMPHIPSCQPPPLHKKRIKEGALKISKNNINCCNLEWCNRNLRKSKCNYYPINRNSLRAAMSSLWDCSVVWTTNSHNVVSLTTLRARIKFSAIKTIWTESQ